MNIPPDRFDQYRPNVGILLFNRTGSVWYGHRVAGSAHEPDATPPHHWQMPQGGIDAGEDIETAARRELAEETGAVTARLLFVTPGWLGYDFPPKYKKRKWRGQRQKWAIMLFEGEDSEFRLDADEHQEFDDWRWGTLEEGPDLIVPFKRDVYDELCRAARPLRDFLAQR